jgi:hypothetical protein
VSGAAGPAESEHRARERIFYSEIALALGTDESEEAVFGPTATRLLSSSSQRNLLCVWRCSTFYMLHQALAENTCPFSARRCVQAEYICNSMPAIGTLPERDTKIAFHLIVSRVQVYVLERPLPAPEKGWVR